MSRLPPSMLLLLLFAADTAAQSQGSSPKPATTLANGVQKSFRPSIILVIGIFSIMFSMTFLILVYSRFCNSNSIWNFSSENNIDGDTADGRTSGIDKAVIESLPFFRFSALKGSREGLECSVCLSRFEDSEILRLLPRCKHAFHMDCVDRWLDSHSSCPLCRSRVDGEDLAFFKYSVSSGCLLQDPSDHPSAPDAAGATGDAALELYVERERAGSSPRRFSASFRWVEKLKKGGESLLPRGGKEAAEAASAAALHNLKHRILVSEVVFRSRWSDFNSADLIRLDSEMLCEMARRRIDPTGAEGRGVKVEQESGWPNTGVSGIRSEMERKRRLENKASLMGLLAPGNITPPETAASADANSSEYSVGDIRALMSPASRSMSDITTVTRNRPSRRHHGEEEERVRQMWLPIARRTVQWFAGKEKVSMPQPGARD